MIPSKRSFASTLLLALATPALAAPPNDDFTRATDLPSALFFSAAGSLVDATMESDEPFAVYEDYKSSVWWRWTPATDGKVVLLASNPQLDTVMAIFEGDSLAGLRFAAYGEDVAYPDQLNSRIRLSVEAGQTYYIAVFGYAGGEDTFKLTGNAIASSPSNDNFSAATDLNSDLPVRATGANRGATVEPFELFHADSINGASVWWRWTAPATLNVSVTTAGSSIDTLLAVYTGNSVDFLDEIASNDDANGNTSTSKATFRALEGTTYYMAVDGYDAELGNIILNVQEQALEKAPPWALKDVDGNLIQSTDYAGKVILLDFWATWCVPCIAEISDFLELQEKYGPQGLAIIGISTDSDATYVNTVREFIGVHGLNYDVVLAESSGVEDRYGGIRAIPTTFIIDREGYIVDQHVGTTEGAIFEAQILPLLAVTPAPPALTGRVTGENLVLKWGDHGGAYRLQQTLSLAGKWEPVLGNPSAANGTWELTLPLTTSGFFRLVPQ